MRASTATYAAVALGLGFFGFVLVEIVGWLRGGFVVLYPLDSLLIALGFAVASLTTALIFRRPLLWARGWRLVIVALPYFTAYALLAGVFSGLFLLLTLGRLPARDDLSMAIFYTPIFALETLLVAWFVSVPLGIVSLWLLRRLLEQHQSTLYKSSEQV
jgi:hypothetical protein